MTTLGTDLGDFNEYGAPLLTGRALHAYDLSWRLQTDEGGLFTDPHYGYPLYRLLNEPINEQRLPAIAHRIEEEVRKDKRTLRAQCELRLDQLDGQRKALHARIGIWDAKGPFSFIADVTTEAFSYQLFE